MSLRIAVFCFSAFLLPTMSFAHDIQGIAAEIEARAAGEAGYDDFSREDIDRLRVFQMLGTDTDAASDVLDEFSMQDEGGSEQVFLANYRWAQNKILTACFFDGTAAERKNVMKVFDSVLVHTNLGLAVTKAPCPVKGVDLQVRIATDGCSSYYGRASKVVIANNPSEATIKLCNRARPSVSKINESTVQHEFMHALGFVHEQQHGDQECFNELDLEKAGTILFPKATKEDREAAVRVNLLSIEKSVSNAVVKELPYDKRSIMHYQLRRELFKTDIEPSCVLAHKNRSLSDGDKRMLRAMYPSGAASRLAAEKFVTPVATRDLITVVAQQVEAVDPVIGQLLSDCFGSADCETAILQAVDEVTIFASDLDLTIDPAALGLETDEPVTLVTGPKPGPGTGGSVCEYWPICNRVSDSALSGKQAESLEEINSAASMLEIFANEPQQAQAQVPGTDEMPGTGGPFCQNNPLCKDLLDRLSTASETLDLTLPQ